MTRGIKHDTDRLITEMQGKYFPSNIPDKDGKPVPGFIQLSVRPINLYEIVFPENSKDVVLNTLLGSNKGLTQHKKHQKFINLIRKILGVKPIPDYKTDQGFLVYKNNVEIIGVGIKEDYYVNEKGEHIWSPSEEDKKKMWEGI